jgi:hypothetical protein
VLLASDGRCVVTRAGWGGAEGEARAGVLDAPVGLYALLASALLGSAPHRRYSVSSASVQW